MAIRKKFSQEFKHEAVQVARSSRQSMSQVARDLGISPSAAGSQSQPARDDVALYLGSP
jgi:transposase-like protein